MKQLTAIEALSISKLLQAETNSLAIAKAGINIISDDELKTHAKSAISAAEARITGLQQFVQDNLSMEQGEVQ